jgi:hypothetical protein
MCKGIQKGNVVGQYIYATSTNTITNLVGKVKNSNGVMRYQSEILIHNKIVTQNPIMRNKEQYIFINGDKLDQDSNFTDLSI